MSYILGALRRADAERQQGQVPGLNAAGAASSAAEPRRPRWLVAAVLVLVALMLMVAAWFGLRRPAEATVPAVNAVVPPSAPLAAPPAPVKETAPSAMPTGVAAPLPIVVSASPAPAAEFKPQPAPAAPAAASAPAVLASPSKPVVRSLLLSALPPDERRQLPALVPGGSVWSDAAASRFVILDGSVLREGDAVAPGLVLEKIERRAALLRWKDQRIEVPF
jgi:general secretion pathway protein B